jgi:LuxR family maltose regulon positive regulatory protein
MADGFEQALGGAAAPAVTIVRVVQGQIAYLDGDMPHARDKLVHAAELARIAGHPALLIRALTALADAHLATGDRTAARAVLQEAQEVVDSWTVPPASAERVAEAQARIGRGAVRAARRQHRLAEELTDRELSILLKLQGPLTQREIARELYLSINTVKGYTKSLYRKLGVTTRLEAVDRARDLGLI